MQQTATTSEKTVGPVTGKAAQTPHPAQPATEQAKWQLSLVYQKSPVWGFHLSSPSHPRVYGITVRMGEYIDVNAVTKIRRPFAGRTHDLHYLINEIGNAVTITVQTSIFRLKSITLDIGGQKVIYEP